MTDKEIEGGRKKSGKIYIKPIRGRAKEERTDELVKNANIKNKLERS